MFSGVLVCHMCCFTIKQVSLFQKKDANVKQIPPFKPLPSSDGTPEGTPEKVHPLSKEGRKVSLEQGWDEPKKSTRITR